MRFRVPFFEKPRHIARMISDSRIEIQFDVDKPVDLVDLTLAFAALSRQYKKFINGFIKEKGLDVPDEDSVRLYVTRIESNCIIAELGWFDLGGLLPVGSIVLMDNANTMIEFLKNLDICITYFREKIGIPAEKQLAKRDYEDFRDLLVPVVKAGKGSLKFKELKYDKDGKPKSNCEMVYVSDIAVKATYGIEDRILRLEATTSDADHKSVLMYLESVERKMEKPDAKRTRDSGVIESVCKNPLPVYWLSELDQQRVKNHEVNPFKINLVVDANVETRQGEPKAYRVVRVVDILSDESTREQPPPNPATI